MERKETLKIISDCKAAHKTLDQIFEYKKAILNEAKSADNPKLLLFYAGICLKKFLVNKVSVAGHNLSMISSLILEIPRVISLAELQKLGDVARDDVRKNGVGGLENVAARSLAQQFLPKNASLCLYHLRRGCLNFSLMSDEELAST